jgi:hypothetical protein
MQEIILLTKLKNINNYEKPLNPVVKGIVYFDNNPYTIVKELFEMLQDNFDATKGILGEEITNLVLTHKLAC